MISLNDVLLAMSNIPVDDPIAEIWGRGLQGGYKIIEYTGSLPITINANGDALLDYRIYGDDGGGGVATENLFDKNSALLNSTINSITGRVDSSSIGRFVSDYIKVNKDDNFTIVNGNNNDYFWLYDINKKYTTIYYNDHTFIADQDGYIRISNNADIDKVMLIKGSTAPTNYIPYGYKLPMTVSDGDTTQTVPVYIGENQLDAIGEYRDYVDFGIQKIARKIREYTFTGNETFNLFAQNAYGTCWVNLRLYTTVAYCPIHQTTLRSSHFTAINNSDANFWYEYPQLDDACNFEVEDGYDTVKIFFRSTANFSTAEECKAYFKEQYDNGTPVKIWFVMKYTVGQYESTDNGKEDPPVPLPEIPSIKGEAVIDYDGDPKPSQMYIKYKGKSDGA